MQIIEKLRSMRMATRQIIGFGAILLLMAGVTIYAGLEVSTINQNLTTMIDKNSVIQRDAINFRGSVHDRAIALRDVVLGDEAEVKRSLADIKNLEADYDSSRNMLNKLPLSPRDQELRENIDAIEDVTMPLIAEIIRLRQSGEVEGAQALLLEKAKPAFETWLKEINVFIDAKEALNQQIAQETRNLASEFVSWTIVLCAVSMLIGIVFAWWNVSSVHALRDVTQSMLKLAEGDLSATFPVVKSRDEVGDIISASAVFRDTMVRSREMAEREAEETRERTVRAEEIAHMTDSFDRDISELLEMMSVASNKMQTTADSMSGIAETSATKTSAAVTAAEQASNNVDHVTQATENLTNTIHEIERLVGQSSTISERAVEEATRTDNQVRGLSEAAVRIGEVVSLISDVAEQTNLLALNATIEAARAGEAGRGFAVVASEVKQLATQTGNATNEISQQINAIQAETREAVEAIQSITSTINEISTITSSVVLAVNEQNTATQDIRNNVTHVTTATNDVTGNMQNLTVVADETDQAAHDVTSATRDLSEKVDLVKSQVEKFLSSVKAA